MTRCNSSYLGLPTLPRSCWSTSSSPAHPASDRAGLPGRAELRGGRTIRLWRDQFGPTPPYPTGSDTLFVAYYASAELGCHRVLGWPMPARILDLFTEFRDRTNGLPTGRRGPAGRAQPISVSTQWAPPRRTKCAA